MEYPLPAGRGGVPSFLLNRFSEGSKMYPGLRRSGTIKTFCLWNLMRKSIGNLLFNDTDNAAAEPDEEEQLLFDDTDSMTNLEMGTGEASHPQKLLDFRSVTSTSS